MQPILADPRSQAVCSDFALACGIVVIFVHQVWSRCKLSNRERILSEAVERGAKRFHVDNFSRHQELQRIFAALIVGQMDQSLICNFRARLRGDIVSQIDIEFARDL